MHDPDWEVLARAKQLTIDELEEAIKEAVKTNGELTAYTRDLEARVAELNTALAGQDKTWTPIEDREAPELETAR